MSTIPSTKIKSKWKIHIHKDFFYNDCKRKFMAEKNIYIFFLATKHFKISNRNNKSKDLKVCSK